MKLMLTNIFMVSELRYLALPNVRFHSCFPTFTSSSDHKLAWGKLNLLDPVWWDGALFWPVSGSGHVSTRSDYQIFFFFCKTLQRPLPTNKKAVKMRSQLSLVLENVKWAKQPSICRLHEEEIKICCVKCWEFESFAILQHDISWPNCNSYLST